jgi:hypothetical protein
VREQRDAAGATPLDYALTRIVALGPEGLSLLAPSCQQRGSAEAGRPGAPRITAVEAHDSEVWLSLSSPTGDNADGPGCGARLLWYEIETVPLAQACNDGASLPDDAPVHTVSAH